MESPDRIISAGRKLRLVHSWYQALLSFFQGSGIGLQVGFDDEIAQVHINSISTVLRFSPGYDYTDSMIPNFSFVLTDRLAGSAFPGYGGQLRELLAELRDQHNIRAIVSLTREDLDRSLIEEYGLEYYHLPIPDFSVPTLEEMAEAVRFVADVWKMGGAVLAHCTAGMGRTGTFLACCLVADGFRANDAITHVRRCRPGSIETREQENLVHAWAESLDKGEFHIKPDSE